MKGVRPQGIASLSIVRRLAVVASLVALILALGTAGYALIEGWSPLEALYMAVITVTTVGFGEVRPLSPQGRVFTLVLVVLGVGAFTYTFSTITDYLIAGELRGFLAKRRMKNQIDKLTDHYIVCGFGRVGSEVAREFQNERRPVVVVDENEDTLQRAGAEGFVVLQGDAGDDHVLEQAGIERARGLIAAADTDTTNLMIVLSARALNPQLFIVARADFKATEAKLLRAGADRVISPYSIGGRRMAQLALRPNVVEFLDVVTRDRSLHLWIEDMDVPQGSGIAGCSLEQSKIRETTGATILALRRRDGQMIVAPTPDTPLQGGDMLVALGTREQLAQLKRLIE